MNRRQLFVSMLAASAPLVGLESPYFIPKNGTPYITPTNVIVPWQPEDRSYPRLKSEWRELTNLDDLRFVAQPHWSGI